MNHPCPCCGCLTFPVAQEEAIAYICPVCYWENNVFLGGPDEASDENHGITLNKARANFQKFGACCIEILPYVRQPKQEEKNP